MTGYYWIIFYTHPFVLSILGLLVGSFLNVIIYRTPKMLERGWIEEAVEGLSSPENLSNASGWSIERAKVFSEQAARLLEQINGLPALTISRPRSRCPHCGHPIAWYENIPILSWLVLRGKCSSCSAPISMRYPLVEMFSCVTFGLVALRHPGLEALWWCGAAATLIALAMIDFDTMLLPDALTLPLLWTALLASACGFLLPMQAAVIGAMAGYMSLWSIYWVFKIATGKEGMGYGDFKLMAALGAWFGAGAIPVISVLSAVVGVFVYVALRITGNLKKDQQMPFGPYLAGAGLALMVIPIDVLKTVFPLL